MKALPPLATRDRVVDAVFVVACGIAQAAALAIAAFATRDAFAALHAGSPLASGTIVELAAAGSVAALCLLASRRRAEALGQSYAIALRRALFERIAQLPKARHETRRVGALALRFVGDLSAARLWFGRGLPDVLTALVVLPGAVVILVALDTRLALAALLPLALALGLMAITAWHLDRRHRHLRRRRANLAIAMVERIAIAPELDLMGRTRRELRALDERGAALRADAVARRSRTAGLHSILQIGVAIAGLAMLWTASRSATPPAAVAAGLSVVALVALPLQDLGAAWDRFCAWRIAREKARRLLAEPSVRRRALPRAAPPGVTLRGEIGDEPVHFAAAPGDLVRLDDARAPMLARAIAGLDRHAGLELRFDGAAAAPRVAFIADAHAGLQGSLRRSATLSAARRPPDSETLAVLTAFGLGDLLGRDGGLDQRIAENGKGLTAGRTLRIDLARAVLGRADVIVISSLRWTAEPRCAALLDILRQRHAATVILAEPADHPTSAETAGAT